jgi:carbon monoxide dehydrogenase subunit G
VIVEGTNEIRSASPDQVFAALADPAVLARVVPGCRELIDRGDGVYDLTIEAGVGSIRGAYAGQVNVAEARPPELYEASLSATGSPGTVQATLRAELSPGESGTQVDYRMDAKLAGPIAGVGQRVVAGVSRKNAQMFFDALERELASNGDGGTVAASEPAPGPEDAARVYPGAPAKASSGAPVDRFVLGVIVGALATALGVLIGRRR